MDSQKGINGHSGTTAVVITVGEQDQPGDSEHEFQLSRVPIYLIRGEEGVFQALNVPARNEVARKSPGLLKGIVAKALQRQAKLEGSFKGTDIVVHWKGSEIPFHIEFEFCVLNKTCYHLASIRNLKTNGPDLYAQSIAPLAKIFLSKSPESRLPHFPFIWAQISSDNRFRSDAQDQQTSETIHHAQQIRNQYNSLDEIDIDTAEATAGRINAGKILSSLLVYLTLPKPRTKEAIMSTEQKDARPTHRASSLVSEQLEPTLTAEKIHSLAAASQHKRVASNTQKELGGVIVTERSSLRESCVPNPSNAGRNLPEEHPAMGMSGRGKKGSKKKNQGRKQKLIERRKNTATSTTSAYPTQRPPRKKPAREPNTINECSERKCLRSEERDVEEVSTSTRPEPTWESDHEKDPSEPLLISGESSEKDSALLDSAAHEHDPSNAFTADKILDPQSNVTDFQCPPSKVIHGEDLIVATDKPALFLPTTSTQEYGRGARGLLWAYATNTKVDDSLEDAGIWLWRKPKTHFRSKPLFHIDRFGRSVLAPVVVSHNRVGNHEPIVEFDGSIVHVVPCEQSWEDVRSHECHPDFLTAWKLAEYQASEAAGYQVWRYDKNLLQCRKPGCEAMISDYDHSAIVCLGCGPKSSVRYCCLKHQMDDIEGHWKECGSWIFRLAGVIDYTSAPSKFARLCPAIKQEHGSRTGALYRQILFCTLSCGHYTLFDPTSGHRETLSWPKQDPKWRKMDQCIERLLNIVFLDSWNLNILGYIYRVLRQLLRSQGQWSERTEQSLKLQMEAEFSGYKVNTKWHNDDDPCQCEWSGRILPRHDHLSTCREYAPTASDYGPVRRPKYMQEIVEDYEAKSWLLRAWQQQHPEQNNWRSRAAGHGFPDVGFVGDIHESASGWIGW